MLRLPPVGAAAASIMFMLQHARHQRPDLNRNDLAALGWATASSSGPILLLPQIDTEAASIIVNSVQ